MAERIRRWARRHNRAEKRKRGASKERAAVVDQIRAEAEEHGATLESDGEGGIDPKIALEVFRRDDWQCVNEDCPTPQENITLDHISGHPKEIEEDEDAREDEALEEGVRLGHVDDPDALHTLCAACHDAVHQRERAIEQGDEPRPMRGAA